MTIIDRNQCLYLRMVPGKTPIMELGKPSFSTIHKLLALSENGVLMVVSSVQVPLLSNVYHIHPGNNDDVAVMSQHLGGISA
jgi:hypothetical protein